MNRPAVYYDPDSGALYVGALKTTDKSVIREASRWATGERGEPVEDLAALEGVDLKPFAREALSIGARVLAIAAQSSDALAVQEAVRSASDQVTDAAQRASQTADDAAKRAAEQIVRTAREANENVLTQVTRLVGGENPELLERLRRLLAQVGTDLEAQVAAGIEKAPTAQRAETKQRHDELTALIRNVQQEVAVKVAEESAAAAVKGSTAIKGFDYETQLHAVLAEIAAGLGDEYQESSEFAGRLSRNKKGDGVLSIDGGLAASSSKLTTGRPRTGVTTLPRRSATGAPRRPWEWCVASRTTPGTPSAWSRPGG